MANSNCCFLVGNFYDLTGFNFNNGCIVSVNNNINTEYNNYGCQEGLPGHSIGTLNISGYAGTNIHSGCAGRAGVQVLWQRKFNCSSKKMVFIFTGEGRSYASGEADSYVSLNETFPVQTEIINASAQSGPTSLFTKIEQIEGQGMTYSKGPINFNTSFEEGCTLENMGFGEGSFYLQNFNIELVPGSMPLANYTFAYNV